MSVGVYNRATNLASARRRRSASRPLLLEDEMQKTHRLQLDFSADALRDLDELREETGLPTRAELIRQALRLLQWTVTETQTKNATILVEKEGKLREVVFPFWMPMREKQEKSKTNGEG